MITKKQFRAAVTLSMVLGILGLTAFFVGQAGLPAPLREYLETTKTAEPTALGWALFAIGIPLIMGGIASFIGMLSFKHWSRPLAVATCVTGNLLLPLFGPTVEPGITTAFYYASCMLFGAVLSLAYYSPAATWFSSSAAAEQCDGADNRRGELSSHE
jgi:predicted MFS family arabinose efflux permease